MNNVDAESVRVIIEPWKVSIAAEHPQKSLRLEIPLFLAANPASSTYTLSAFGVNLVLRKQEIQALWGSLLPAKVPVPKTSHVWWELRTKVRRTMVHFRAPVAALIFHARGSMKRSSRPSQKKARRSHGESSLARKISTNHVCLCWGMLGCARVFVCVCVCVFWGVAGWRNTR